MSKILREPLLHFLFLGLLLFGLFDLVAGPPGGSERRVVISQAMSNEMAQGFQATWQRPPTPEELKALVDTRVREELLYREGVALGLDRDDPVIRRRVAQKVEVMAEESALSDAIDDAELERYLQRNAQRYALPAEVAFEQVLFAPDTHGAQLQANLASGLQRLQAGAAAEQVGDRTQLPARVEATPADLVAREFGEPFAAALPELPLGSWAGPVASGFGWHLVRLQSLTPARPASLKDVRKAVERDWENERRMQAKQAYYEQLGERYEVIIEPVSPVGEARQ
ncbi:peptidyl-prolyl cis-trans isomerase [Pseudomonas sp. N040]|uniref:peptidylprolyl isomerase n=1 Tax=Pseudomonas sp. N040 TaxID=2785325 RepID=UPI0018A32094|nr:peptidylprolyl isomerase [Pseudomonas sp. N040]MBF7730091.1 peptidyl-prolyl cis-trans isomerase [Pseudomonas sp. N040]MBW7013733.1 peptidyl-prolyl cis-trans isomerase [Pseudomonas sp. N040]